MGLKIVRVQALNLFLNLHGNYLLKNPVKYAWDSCPISKIFYYK